MWLVKSFFPSPFNPPFLRVEVGGIILKVPILSRVIWGDFKNRPRKKFSASDINSSSSSEAV
jgi:hypothetical protein